MIIISQSSVTICIMCFNIITIIIRRPRPQVAQTPVCSAAPRVTKPDAYGSEELQKAPALVYYY